LDSLSAEDRVGHLLRRFAFGASEYERARYRGLEPEAVLERLLEMPPAGDNGVHPLRFAFREGEEADAGAWRFRAFWIYQMIVSDDPLREKLALFWHSHFAANGEKVEDGLAMLEYMQELRRGASDPFPVLLGKMARNPALLKMLDVRLVARRDPNENFARELMELYTLGAGQFSEADVKSAARSFTGWCVMAFDEDEKTDSTLRRMERVGAGPTVFAIVPAAVEEAPRRLLGREVRNADETLAMLASHPATARLVTAKLWDYFAGTPLPDALGARLSERFLSTGGDVRATIREIASADEFWSERCLGTKVKSPVEYAIGICRAFGLGPYVQERIDRGSAFDHPIQSALFDELSGVAWHLEVMGQNLLHPPSVNGWDEGAAWISEHAMMARRRFGGFWLWVTVQKDGKEQWVAGAPLRGLARRLRANPPVDPEAFAKRLESWFDCPLEGESHTALVEKLRADQAMEALGHEDWLCGVVSGAWQLLRLAPRFHTC
jgi:uncharacterized protein (DUF1800 family)